MYLKSCYMQKVHTTLGIVKVFNVLRLLDKSAKLFRNQKRLCCILETEGFYQPQALKEKPLGVHSRVARVEVPV